MVASCFPINPDSTSSNATTTAIPSSNPGTTTSPNHIVTSTYQTFIFNTPSLLTLTWSRTNSSHTLTLDAPHFFSVTISLLSRFLCFHSSRFGSGSKSILLPPSTTSQDDYSPTKKKVKLYWDFTKAAEEKFPSNSKHELSAEPDSSSFYLAITINSHLVFFLGELNSDFARRVGSVKSECGLIPIPISKREHLFGRRRNYSTVTEFAGWSNKKHDIEIGFGGGGMKVKIDGEVMLSVKRLQWKFRGNQRIMINGIEVEFFWDVFNWINNTDNNSGSGVNASSVSINGNEKGRHGVFVFQIGNGGVSPPCELTGPEKKLLMGKSTTPSELTTAASLSPAPSWTSSSVLQWAEESSSASECGRRSSNSSSGTNGSSSWEGDAGSGGGVTGGRGFSLVLYAWRRD